jgi:hypothetical protein
MHREILTEEQVNLLPLVKSFSRKFGLVGGTAMAFHLGHRESIDFDLFTDTVFKNSVIGGKIRQYKKIDRVVTDETGQFTVLVNGVRMTFFHYPFRIRFTQSFADVIKLPDLLTLAAMKAYALGRRAKWKDYVDLYFIAKKYGGISPIARKAKKIFGNEFNEKIFRAQLAYFEDVDYSETVVFMPGFEAPDATIKRELIKFSIS